MFASAKRRVRPQPEVRCHPAIAGGAGFFATFVHVMAEAFGPGALSFGTIAAAAVLGLMAGSFLNVAIYRLPRLLDRHWSSESVDADGAAEAKRCGGAQIRGLTSARSRCPNCGRALRVRHLVPVVSFAALRGRCAWCRWRIPFRYPAVELISAGMSALVVWRFGFGAAMMGALLVTWALIVLSAIDIDTQTLPDVVTLPLLWLGLAFNLWAVFVPLSSAVLGTMAGYLALWAIYHAFRLLTGKEGMGRGDFKLLAMLGAWLGWQAVPVVLVLASATGALVGTSLLALGVHRKGSPLAFGPYLAGAGWLNLMWGEQIVAAYLHRVG